MNRAERRAKERCIKGGANCHDIRGHDRDHTMLSQMVKYGKDIEKKKSLRSKQVPGY